MNIQLKPYIANKTIRWPYHQRYRICFDPQPDCLGFSNKGTVNLQIVRPVMPSQEIRRSKHVHIYQHLASLRGPKTADLMQEPNDGLS